MALLRESRRFTDEVLRVLHSRIVHGEMAPGSRVDIEALANEMGISRTPVREAILRLEEMGLVERQAYRGSIVSAVDPSRLEEVTALRIDLEGLATELGVPHLLPADVRRMRELLQQIDDQSAESEFSYGRFNELNREFHATVYRAGAGPALMRLIDSLSTEADRMRLHFNARNELAGAYHRRILDACASADAEEAARLTRAHLLDAYFGMSGNNDVPDGILRITVQRTRTVTLDTLSSRS